MSYAIVRNEKLTRAEINGKGTHNDRKAKNHSNKDNANFISLKIVLY